MSEDLETNHELGILGEILEKDELKRPPLFRVLLHNDHFTTREFVVNILQTVFHKTENEAVQIMLHVHHKGLGIAGIYSFEVAETKVRTVEKLAQAQQYPLRLSLEPEE